MYKKYYAVTVVIKADDADEAQMVAETMVGGTTQGVLLGLSEATPPAAWAYDRVEENR